MPARLLLVLLAALHLGLAWPGAGERGVIAEEVTPYLPHHPRVLAAVDAQGVTFFPPHDRPAAHGWVSTGQWPNLSYVTPERTWPVLIRGHQSALGTYPGIAAAPLLGGGIAGIRRTSVLLGLVLLGLVFALARRLAPGPTEAPRGPLAAPLRFAALVTLLCLLSPGLLFFARTGYGFELASRLGMLVTLLLAADPRPLSARRGLALALALAAALAARATIAATLLPPLLLLLSRQPRRASPLLALGLGLGLPVLAALALRLAVPPYPGTLAAADLPLAELADRTWSAPAHLAAQLAWVADPGVVLRPLIGGAPPDPTLPLALGAAVLLLALVRWWRARATDGECLFAAAALGNALCGAWLYGHPQQFQLGMALEPLFALALAGQLASLARPALARPALALVLALRAWQCGALLVGQRATANPMLSGAAQRALVADLARLAPGPGALVTTTYNHVGVLEIGSSGQLAPIHAYAPLRAGGDLVAAWRAILRARPVRLVVLTTGRNPFEGPFTDNAAVAAALRQAAAQQGLRLGPRTDYACESGDPCLALQRLEPAAP